MKIILAASSGGHLEEIKSLDMLRQRHQIRYLVVKNKVNANMKDVLFVPEYRNNLRFRKWIDLVRIFAVSWGILLREKPDVVISTGCAATFPACWLQKKIFRKKVIYIESFARKTTGSKTGRMVYPFADHFVVQHKELLSVFPRGIYGGMIF